MDISELVRWHTEKCDGDWEHQGGIAIGTLDNPGWSITIEYDTFVTAFDESVSVNDNWVADDDFIFYKFDAGQNRLTVMCSAHRLSEALEFVISNEKRPAAD